MEQSSLSVPALDRSSADTTDASPAGLIQILTFACIPGAADSDSTFWHVKDSELNGAAYVQWKVTTTDDGK
ncbi:hypothetical protein H257_05971 [Aphanomyces astaci]|uniref:Uncharacterized protein n=1 Tax=Aphanomyces astaci TaxID=112090 RepID=W4GQ42_APHAT|nr:hypothetical protein H257_05971 [Aphanomyces astaci]ETV81446.1 hypothetical protein H257_05971 [Aphanomyces astaci]|eukprot:XP_009829304.1 hypothetical protein H257_05971 [Aphanomyces astaci]